MKDKSVAMPCESSGVARAWLIKPAIDAQATKTRRCTAFPQRRSILQSTILSRDNETRCYDLTVPFASPRFSRLGTRPGQDQRLSRAHPVGQGQPVFAPDRRLSFETGGGHARGRIAAAALPPIR